MKQNESTVTLPPGVSLQRVGQVLLEAWEVGGNQWNDSPLQLQEAGPGNSPPPLPQDALELFKLLAERKVSYLLVGGIAMLTYVQGRNTRDVDLLLSVEALSAVPELHIEERADFFIKASFRSLRVDLLLTTNPLFKLVQERFATMHRFAEREVPAATVDGLLVLKLYALPSLYRQLDWDRVYLYESDVKQLLARYRPNLEPIYALLAHHILASDLRELQKMIAEAQQRQQKMGRRRRTGET